MVSLATQSPLAAPRSAGIWNSITERAKQNPVGEWTAAFEQWIAQGAQFREFESNEFFPNHESPVQLRMHRGWLCDIIASGELLAMALLHQEVSERIREPLMKQLDEFLLCYATTLDTWHAPDDRRQAPNPIDQFCSV